MEGNSTGSKILESKHFLDQLASLQDCSWKEPECGAKFWEAIFLDYVACCRDCSWKGTAPGGHSLWQGKGQSSKDES